MRVVTAFIGLMFSLAACAQSDGPTFAEGNHYQKLPEKVRTTDPDKIEVREVFAYTCGHCFKFEPLVSEWKGQQKDDVVFLQTPAVWAKQMEPFARAFYTARALDILDDAHMDLFNAIHLQRQRFRGADDFAEFYSQYGVSEDKFLKTFESFGVSSQVRQAESRVRAYNVSGTPELIVDGQYRISARDAGSHEKMLQVADYLVEQIRAGEI